MAYKEQEYIHVKFIIELYQFW